MIGHLKSKYPQRLWSAASRWMTPSGVSSSKNKSPSIHLQYNSNSYSTTSLVNNGVVEKLLEQDPSKFISGLTKEQIQTNPEIMEYIKANYEIEKDNNNNVDNGISLPIELLKEYGIVLDENDTASAKKRLKKKKKKYGDQRIDYGLGTQEQQDLNIRVLKSYQRREDGTRFCNRLRLNEGMIPGILYGNNPIETSSSNPSNNSKMLLQTPWAELQRELDRYHRRFECRVYDLTVYENDDDDDDSVLTTTRVMPCNVQRHPVEGKIYCANFVRYHSKRPIKIPLMYINAEESPALKRDGYIIPVSKHIECYVEDGVRIPDALEVECTGLALKDVIRMDRVIFPDGVRPTDRVDIDNFVVGPVRGGRGGSTADDDADGDGAGKKDGE
jgi:large subunit ribosomal protein L25